MRNGRNFVAAKENGPPLTCVKCTATAQKRTLATHRHKGGNNTKIHAVVDSNCRPLKLLLSAGNLNDIKLAPNFLECLSLEGATACISCKKSYKIKWEIDKEQYKKRNVVERYFQGLKENRLNAL